MEHFIGGFVHFKWHEHVCVLLSQWFQVVINQWKANKFIKSEGMAVLYALDSIDSFKNNGDRKKKRNEEY